MTTPTDITCALAIVLMLTLLRSRVSAGWCVGIIGTFSICVFLVSSALIGARL